MESRTVLGLGLIGFAGIMMGCSVVPMKYATKWKWENIWLAFVGFAQVILPLILVVLTVPSPAMAFKDAKTSALVGALLFGLGWGIGNTLSGIGYTMLGVGLGLSIVLGLTASLGSLVPLAVLFPDQLKSPSAKGLYAGVISMMLALALVSLAGNIRQSHRRREEITSGADIEAFGKGNIRIGLIICIGAGILSSMLNLAFVFGDDIRLRALHLGATPAAAVNALWLPILFSGFLPTLFYCAYLMKKNKSGVAYFAKGTSSHWLIAALMGVLFLGGLSIYGYGTVLLGELGPVFGFPAFMSSVVLTGNFAGFVTGEWQGSPKKAYIVGLSGLLLLVAAIIMIGIGKVAIG
jgi:L-rhamnose-H+ transport protein